jgi:hypothetical protein
MDSWHLNAREILRVLKIIAKEIIDLAEFQFIIEPEFFVSFTLLVDLKINELSQKLSLLLENFNFTSIRINEIATFNIMPRSHYHDICNKLR